MESTGQSSNAEEIRLKRVAKMQQEADERKKREAEEIASIPTNSASMEANKPLTPKDSIDHKFTASVAPPSETNAPTIVQTKQPVTSKSFEDWQNDALCRILQITLNASYGQGRFIYLRNLANELEQENEPRPFRLSQKLMDRALVDRLSIDPNESHDEIPPDLRQGLRVPLFYYLLNCWKRAQDIRKNLIVKGKSLDRSVMDERLSVLDAVKQLLVSYSGIVLQMPDLFPQIEGSALDAENIVSRFLAEPDTPEGLPLNYITELIVRFHGDGLDTILGPTMASIFAAGKKIDLLGDFRSPLQSLTVLCENKAFAAALPSICDFDPQDANARNFEDVSFLGPYLRLTAYPTSAPQIAESLFQNFENRNSADIESAKSGLRGSVNNLQFSLFNICNSIVRADATARESLLAYFAHVIRLNEKRAQMQVNLENVATEGFMHNITGLLLKFADPFMDLRATKVMWNKEIDKIDSSYLRTSHRLNVSEDTKINASKEQADEYYKNAPSTQAHNFITEIFFLTLAFLHYGPIRSLINYNDLMREYSETKKQTERMERETLAAANGTQAVMQEFVLKRFKAKLEIMTMHKLAYESMIMDGEFLSQIMRFYNLVMAWLVRLVDPSHKHPWQSVTLPLPSEIPETFCMLPEWIIEDIVEYFIFLGKYGYATRVIKDNPQEELVTFTITFLRNTKYIKNPYLKAKLAEILFFFTYPIAEGYPGELEAQLNSHPLALKHLVPSLMQFYVEVEQTGASSQFYDKFNIRYNISHVMKTIWNHPSHRENLQRESRNSEDFTRFVNMLISDVTYLLDESLSKLAEIYQIQNEMKDVAAWQAQSPPQRQERENQFRALERQAQSYVALGNETVNMLQYMTAEVKEPFLVSEIVDRLAATLDYNLSQLVGPKCTELKVSNREKYHFKPRVLLSQIIDIYLNLNSPELVGAVARDGRSYKKEYFFKACDILTTRGEKDSDQIAKVKEFVALVEKAIQTGVEEEEELGDIPEEFLDPIFFSLMEDPVLLPTSSVIVDRSTIRAHLLGDTRDPFNRAPLSMDMVQPATELKQKIQDWKAQQKANKNAMDTRE
ncbi:hypothetical protein EC973_005541 [Apophysomyces ossiformis]|uniref:RING-type E3 ubiquitin transferase n=1 Tax=Apophysomyces ossiformis TaxID=679940 RepID=A0A8H7EL96_9FUNG|nr:hypothetical protein EC973_005541 [Apophysomyces ossiformis]